MLRYLLILFLLLPLAGLIQMENGAYGRDIGINGYPNGSSFGYVIHLIFFFIFFYFFNKIKFINLPYRKVMVNKIHFLRAFRIVIFFQILIFLVMFFGYGGYKVWFGVVGKGEFRKTLGVLGAMAYWNTYFFLPASLAYLSFLYKNLNYQPIQKTKILLILSYLMAILSASLWGFKSTAIFVMLPGLCVIFWDAPIKKYFSLGLLFTLMLIFFSFLFDGFTDIKSSLLFIYERATIMTGNTAWLIWEIRENTMEFQKVEYYKFLFAALGNNLMENVFNVAIRTTDALIYNYSAFITSLTGYSDGGIAIGHNVTGTSFGEGLVALGNPGYILFSSISGMLGGFLYSVIRYSYYQNYFIIGTVFLTYFVSLFLGWLMGGGIVVLFHISYLMGLLITLMGLVSLNFFVFKYKGAKVIKGSV